MAVIATGNIVPLLQAVANRFNSTTVGALPAAASNLGQIYVVTDSLTPTVGSNVAAGGAAVALVWSNGANWTVIGK
jgi:hypothetical protein